MTTTQKSTLTDYLVNGYSQQADAGAQQAQGAPARIKICGDCGGKVCFVQSAKTGKWYLADVFPYERSGYFYVKSNPHFKSCGRRQAEVEIVRLQEQIKTVNDARFSTMDRILDEERGNANDLEVRAMIADACAPLRSQVEALEARIAELRAEGARG